MIGIKIIKAIIVRAALVLHVLIAVWRVTVILNEPLYWLMLAALLPFAIEALYTIFKRHGEDFLMFTPCFFFYLLAVVPNVWILELDKTDSYIKGISEETKFNASEAAKEDDVIPTPDINPKLWNIIVEELLLYLLIVSRWVLPRGEITREQLSELLFAFIGVASDIMEMFSLFGEEPVRKSRLMGYLVLAVWTLAIQQFCMTLTVTHQPKKAKNIRGFEDDVSVDHERKSIRNEIGAIILTMCMQDVPFLAVRLYTIIHFDLITYSLIFFTAKNVLVISLLLYKIAVLIQKRFCPEPESDEVEEIEENDKNGFSKNFDNRSFNSNSTSRNISNGSSEKSENKNARKRKTKEKKYEAVDPVNENHELKKNDANEQYSSIGDKDNDGWISPDNGIYPPETNNANTFL